MSLHDIRFEQVTFGFGNPPLYEGLSLVFEAGRRHALIGPNATGKTSLLRLATGRYRPTEGRVFLGDREVAALKPRERAQRIAVVPQFETNVFPVTVRELVATGRYCRQPGLFSGEADPAIDDALEQAGVAHLAARSVWSLSGGERQRTLIARALAQEAGWLLLDEPTTFLDLRAEWELIELLGDLCRDGLSVLTVTHDLQAAGDAESVTLLGPGGPVQGPPEKVLTAEHLSTAYGVPLEVERRGTRTFIMPARREKEKGSP